MKPVNNAPLCIVEHAQEETKALDDVPSTGRSGYGDVQHLRDTNEYDEMSISIFRFQSLEKILTLTLGLPVVRKLHCIALRQTEVVEKDYKLVHEW